MEEPLTSDALASGGIFALFAIAFLRWSLLKVAGLLVVAGALAVLWPLGRRSRALLFPSSCRRELIPERVRRGVSHMTAR